MAAPVESAPTKSAEVEGGAPDKPSRQKFASTKTRFKEWIGYDPQVVEAASVTDTCRRAFSGNVLSATGNYLHSLFPIVDVSAFRNDRVFEPILASALTVFPQWIGHYPWRKEWWAGDLIAGLSVGLVLGEFGRRAMRTLIPKLTASRYSPPIYELCQDRDATGRVWLVFGLRG